MNQQKIKELETIAQNPDAVLPGYTRELIAHIRMLERWLKILEEAAELQVLNFQRQRASGRCLGDDDHETWVALVNALGEDKNEDLG